MKHIFSKEKSLIYLIIIELLLCAFCLPKMWENKEPQQLFAGTVTETTTVTVPYQKVGVIKVTAEYSATEGTISTINTLNNNNIYKGTYANSIQLFGGQSMQHTTIWLTTATEQLQLEIVPAENANLVIQNLEVVRTNQGPILAITCIVLLSSIIDGIWLYLTWIKGKENAKERRWVMAGIVGITLLASLPLLVDYCLEGTELHYHLFRIEDMREGLSSGQLFTKIQADWANGSGNVFLLLPAFLRILGFPVQTAYKISLLLFNFGATEIAYYCFKGIFKDYRIGLIATLLYLWAPYRLDALYAKADYSESIAICFIPMVLYGFWRLLEEEMGEKEYHYVWILPAVGLACILQAHTSTFEAVVLMVLLLCILYGKKICTKQFFGVLCKVVLTVCVLNITLVGSLIHYLFNRDLWVTTAMPLQPKGVYWLHIFTAFFQNGDFRDFKEQRMQGTAALGIGFALTCLLLLYIWTCYTKKYEEQRKTESLWRFSKKLLGVGMVLLVMSTRYFPWDVIRERRIVQIVTVGFESPADFLPVATICFVVLGCTLVKQIWQNESTLVATYLLTAVLGISIVTTQFLVNDFLRSRSAERIYAGECLNEAEIMGTYSMPKMTE